MQITHHQFRPHDLIAGHLALDLANTVTARDSEPHDWLAGYGALLQWAGLTGRFAPHDLARLAQLAAERPAAAGAALARCRQLREALHDSLVALQGGKAVPLAVLQTLDRLRQAGNRRLVMEATRQGIRLRPKLEHAGLDLVTDTVLLDALPLLDAPPLDRVRVCAGAYCGWLFIDSSKAGRRRWCDMATCGASHKAQRTRSRAAARPHPAANPAKDKP